MIYTEDGRTQMTGNFETVWEDFIATNIAMRNLLKEIGVPQEGINEIMTHAVFKAAEEEGRGLVVKSEKKITVVDDFLDELEKKEKKKE